MLFSVTVPFTRMRVFADVMTNAYQVSPFYQRIGVTRDRGTGHLWHLWKVKI